MCSLAHITKQHSKFKIGKKAHFIGLQTYIIVTENLKITVVQNKFYNNFENYILALNEVGKTVFRSGISITKIIPKLERASLASI